MRKTDALRLIGGSVSEVAALVGVSASAVSQWPDELPRRLEDRVLAVLARRHLPAEVIGGPVSQPAEALPHAA